MTFVISRQVSEFKSDTIQTTSENRALPTKKLFLNSICYSSKRSSALSAPLLTLATLESESRRIIKKGIVCSSCIWHPSKGSFTTGKKKKKKIAAPKPGPRLHVRFSLSSNDGKRGHTVLPPSNHLANNISVCFSLSMSRLPYPWRPCQPPLPTTAPQLRCDLWPRPK